jgi:hypothetical protein
VRARYLFALARWCHIGPREVDQLTIGDFANLTEAIDEMVRQADAAG